MPDPSAEPAQSRIVAISNQKGGVGKTTTAINLAASLAARGEDVVLIDLDPQGNASTGLGIDRARRGDGAYGLITGDRGFNAVVRATGTPKLRVVPAETGLAGAEIELVAYERREYRLTEALRPVLERPDRPRYILIDCPPSLGLLTLNAMVASNAVLVPLQCEFLALEGLSQVTGTIDLVRKSLNKKLALHGIVLTMFDRRNNLSELVETDVRGFFGAKVYDVVIPRNVRISEAPSHGKSVLEYDPKSAGAPPTSGWPKNSSPGTRRWHERQGQRTAGTGACGPVGGGRAARPLDREHRSAAAGGGAAAGPIPGPHDHGRGLAGEPCGLHPLQRHPAADPGAARAG